MKKLQLTPEQLEKITQAKARKESTKIDEEWAFIARFGYYYGWEAIMSILNNEISLETAIALLEGAEKVHASHVVDNAVGSQVAFASVNAKKGKSQSVFKKGMAQFIKKAKV